MARWRTAGLAASGSFGPGPAWCWLTPAGMAATGQHYRARQQPSLSRLAHIRAVLAARLWLQAAPAYARIRDRFAELHTQRTQAENKLAELTAAKPRAADPDILEELPYCQDILNDLPPALKARLFAAIDLNVLWNKTGGQVTVYATITDQTLTALPGILNPGQDGYHDTAAPSPAIGIGALAQPPIADSEPHSCSPWACGAVAAVAWVAGVPREWRGREAGRRRTGPAGHPGR